MAPHFIRMVGGAQQQAFPINKAQLTLGRGQEADIVLESRFASREHAELHYSDGVYTLYVPDGKQVAVNGQPITGQHRLVPGDLVDFPEEQFLFGEVKVEVGPKAAPKADPMRYIILVAVIGILGYVGYTMLNPVRRVSPPRAIQIDLKPLNELASEHPELATLRKQVFFQGDYLAALDELDNVGSIISPEQKAGIKELLLKLMIRDIAVEYYDGVQHYMSFQWDSSRTNFNTVVRLQEAFEGEEIVSSPLPPRPDVDQQLTVQQAIEWSIQAVENITNIIEQHEVPHKELHEAFTRGDQVVPG